jgi:hypothetical protein
MSLPIDQRDALQVLARSPLGTTESIMMAYGFGVGTLQKLGTRRARDRRAADGAGGAAADRKQVGADHRRRAGGTGQVHARLIGRLWHWLKTAKQTSDQASTPSRSPPGFYFEQSWVPAAVTMRGMASVYIIAASCFLTSMTPFQLRLRRFYCDSRRVSRCFHAAFSRGAVAGFSQLVH